MIKVIFFDFDGVLTTDPNGKTAIFRNFEQKLPDVKPEKIQECFLRWNEDTKCGKIQWEDVWDDFCTCLGVNVPIAVLSDVFGNVRMNLPVVDLVKTLKQNEYKLGIISSNPTERMVALRDSQGLDNIFEYFITSGDIGVTKGMEGERKIFEKALALSGSEANSCVFVDNHEANLHVPKEMGFHTYYFDTEKNDVGAFKEFLLQNDVTLK